MLLTASWEDLFAQPHERDERGKGAQNDKTALKYVGDEIVSREHVKRQRKQWAHRAGEKTAIYSTGGERHDGQPRDGHQCRMQPELHRLQNVLQQACDDVFGRQPLRHVRIVYLSNIFIFISSVSIFIYLFIYFLIQRSAIFCSRKSLHFVYLIQSKLLNECLLLGANENLCLQSSQYSFLLYLSHWTKLCFKNSK